MALKVNKALAKASSISSFDAVEIPVNGVVTGKFAEVGKFDTSYGQSAAFSIKDGGKTESYYLNGTLGLRTAEKMESLKPGTPIMVAHTLGKIKKGKWKGKDAHAYNLTVGAADIAAVNKKARAK